MKSTYAELLDADWGRLSCLRGVPGCKRGWGSYFHPRFTPVVLIRTAFILNQKGWSRLSKVTSLLNFLIFNIEVPASLRIGPGFVLPHPQGSVLGAREIGSNVTIFQQVTLGAKAADFSYDPLLRPLVEDGVTISAGAKVLGQLTLASGCVVGANAVVLSDVPEGTVAVGVPAKIHS